ncbi:hypothetical protein DRJ17_03065 [Candidatus Woesearchaeota archaeon]|nr:MAG: hypothetical protein DRJ17_03065 [Candidatus Woesearchaeota archaeon]
MVCSGHLGLVITAYGRVSYRPFKQYKQYDPFAVTAGRELYNSSDYRSRYSSNYSLKTKELFSKQYTTNTTNTTPNITSMYYENNTPLRSVGDSKMLSEFYLPDKNKETLIITPEQSATTETQKFAAIDNAVVVAHQTLPEAATTKAFADAIPKTTPIQITTPQYTLSLNYLIQPKQSIQEERSELAGKILKELNKLGVDEFKNYEKFKEKKQMMLRYI